MLDAVWDALRWQFLGALDLVEEGGTFVVWIFMCGVVLWTLIIERYWYCSRVFPREQAKLLTDTFRVQIFQRIGHAPVGDTQLSL